MRIEARYEGVRATIRAQALYGGKQNWPMDQYMLLITWRVGH